jgi:hypothetical protein
VHGRARVITGRKVGNPYKTKRNLLYDPHRDGVPELSITAMVMGNPPPGRRELLMRGRRDEPHLEEDDFETMLRRRPLGR